MTIKVRNSVAFVGDSGEVVKLDAPPTPKNLTSTLRRKSNGAGPTHYLRLPQPRTLVEYDTVFEGIGGRADGRAPGDLAGFAARLAKHNIWRFGAAASTDVVAAQDELLGAFNDERLQAALKKHVNVDEIMGKSQEVLASLGDDAHRAAQLLTAMMFTIDLDMTEDGGKVLAEEASVDQSQHLQTLFLTMRRIVYQALCIVDNTVPLTPFTQVSKMLKSTSAAGNNPEEVILHVLSEKIRGDSGYFLHFLLEKFAFIKPGAIDDFAKMSVQYNDRLDLGEMLYSHLFGEDHPGWAEAPYRTNISPCYFSASALIAAGATIVPERKGVRYAFAVAQQTWMRGAVRELHVPALDLSGLRKNTFFSVAYSLNHFDQDGVVSSYYTLVAMLAAKAEDVALLRRLGVISHDFASDEACVDFVARVARAPAVQRHLGEHIASGLETMMGVVAGGGSVVAKRSKFNIKSILPALKTPGIFLLAIAVIVLLVIQLTVMSSLVRLTRIIAFPTQPFSS